MTVTRPVVAIIGRPNVGKSTLFNRVIRKKMAIVDDKPGITRDRLYAETSWADRHFFLVDTGGLTLTKRADLLQAVSDQAKLAIQKADVTVFMVDLQVGCTLEDLEIAKALHRSRKKVILVLNKGDMPDAEENRADFLRLGLGEGMVVSSLHGQGIGELLDRMVQRFPPGAPLGAEEGEGIRVAVLGRPNVGKSSLVNAIVGEERVVVDEVPGTTRDAVDTVFHMGDQAFVLIDTAGLKRRGKIKGGVEFYSTLRTLRSLDRCHVALLVMDAAAGPTSQDLKIAGQIQEAYKGMVVVLNKWDLLEGQGRRAETYEEQLKKRYPSMSSVPVVIASALTGMHIPLVLEQISAAYWERGKRITTSQLNKFLDSMVSKKQPPSVDGRPTKIYYVTQQGIHPPTFIFFTNNPRGLTAPYRRYLSNQLRRSFGFQGASLRILVRKRRS